MSLEAWPKGQFVLAEDAPNNALLRHYGVRDRLRGGYAVLGQSECWGLTLAQAQHALAQLEEAR